MTLGLRRRSLALLFGLLVLIAACSSEADPGEVCDVPGGIDGVCSGGTVCGKPTDSGFGALVCIPICDDDKHCPKDYDCKGVDGTSVKGCRAK